MAQPRAEVEAQPRANQGPGRKEQSLAQALILISRSKGMEDKNHLHSTRIDRTEENVTTERSRPPEVGERQDFFPSQLSSKQRMRKRQTWVLDPSPLMTLNTILGMVLKVTVGNRNHRSLYSS